MPRPERAHRGRHRRQLRHRVRRPRGSSPRTAPRSCWPAATRARGAPAAAPDRRAGASVRAARPGLDGLGAASSRPSWDRPLDLLVNNAGVMAPPQARHAPRTVSSCSSARTTSGHFVLTGLLLPALIDAGAGRVVTVASIAHHGGTEDVLDANAGRAVQPAAGLLELQAGQPAVRHRAAPRARPPAGCRSPRSRRTRASPRPAWSATARAWARTRSCAWSAPVFLTRRSRSRRRPGRGRSCTPPPRPSRAPTPARVAAARRAARSARPGCRRARAGREAGAAGCGR